MFVPLTKRPRFCSENLKTFPDTLHSRAASTSKMVNILVPFFEGSGVDEKGRTLLEMIQFSDRDLENGHDYIQTMFPLPEGSRFNWDSSLVDRKVFEAFRSRLELQDNLRKAFERILLFWGFRLSREDDGLKVIQAENWESASRIWVTRFNHNHLRITRVIRSLRVLGLGDEAVAFKDALTQDYLKRDVSPKSMLYWTRAACRPLHIAPDVDEGEEQDVVGQKFLRDSEK
ncbi:MAG: hypothetical protein M1818_000697 [Claussenomyces sp. TS43310]|nr:MAG: hypothetical protein M1818_000697 [Claussenomyces sp. TS43310]